MAEPCFNAKVLAATLLGSSETFAKEMIAYSNELNTIKALSGEKRVNRNREQIYSKISVALDARLLRGEAGDEAKKALTRQIASKGWSMKQAVDFFNELDNLTLKDIDTYAGLLFKEGEDYETVAQAMDNFKENVATHIVTEYHLKKKYGVKDGVISVDKEGTIALTDEGKKFIEDKKKELVKIQDKIKKAGGKGKDKKLDEKAEKLSAYIQELSRVVDEIVPLGNRWTETIKELEGDFEEIEHKVNNYIIGSVFLGQAKDEVIDGIVSEIRGHNFLPNLTKEKIESIDSLNKILNIIYANAADIANNKKIRKALKLKLYELMNDGNGKINETALANAEGLMNTLYYCDVGDSFRDVLTYFKVGEDTRRFLRIEKGVDTLKHNKTIFNEIKRVLDDGDFIKNIGTKDTPKEIDFLGASMNGEDFLRLLYVVTRDENLKEAIKLHKHISDENIFEYAKLKIFGGNPANAEKNVKYLIENFTRPYKYQDVTAMGFKVTSSIAIPEEDFGKVTFINFDKRTAAENVDLGESYGARASYNDALADVNTLTVSRNGVASDRNVDLSDGPTKNFPINTKYIVIPNSKYASDVGFKKQLQDLSKYRQENLKKLKKDLKNAESKGEDVSRLQSQIKDLTDDVFVVYPKGRESGQYFVDRSTKQIKYKTTNSRYFNELSRDLAANTFNKATIELTENTEDAAMRIASSQAQKEKDLNEKALNFWRHFLGIEGEKVSPDQILGKLSEFTGVPFKLDEMDAEQWNLAQNMAFNHYTSTANYSINISTSEEISKAIDAARGASVEDIVRELQSKGYMVNPDVVRKNLDSIREAMVGMATSSKLSDYLWFKGVKIGLATNPGFKEFSLSQVKEIMNSKDPLLEMANAIFGAKEFTEGELRFADSYLGDLTDALVDDFVTNLTKIGYQIPLASPDKALIKYIKGEKFFDERFVQDFIYKNGLAADEGEIRQIFDDNIPMKSELWSDITADDVKEIVENKNMGNITISTPSKSKAINKLDNAEREGTVVVTEIPEGERMLPTWHNSYWAAVGGRPVSKKTLNAVRKLMKSVQTVSEPEIRKSLNKFFTEKELEDLGVEFIDNMVDKMGRRVWGGFQNNRGRRMFRFASDAAEGTAEHETVHAFIDMFVTPEERNRILKYALREHGEEITKFAQKYGYEGELIDMRAEEWLAENFINYVKAREARKNLKGFKKIGQDIIDFFEWLYQKVLAIAGKENQIDALYRDIYNKDRSRALLDRAGHDWRWEERVMRGEEDGGTTMYRGIIGTNTNPTKLRSAISDIIKAEYAKRGNVNIENELKRFDELDEDGKAALNDLIEGRKLFGVDVNKIRAGANGAYNRGGITIAEKDAINQLLDGIENGDKIVRLSDDLLSPVRLQYFDSDKRRHYRVRQIPGTRRNDENGFTHVWNPADDNGFKQYWTGIDAHTWTDTPNQLFHVRGYRDRADDAYKVIEVQSDFYQGKSAHGEKDEPSIISMVGADDFKGIEEVKLRELLRAGKKQWQKRAFIEELALALEDAKNGGPSKFWLATPYTVAVNEFVDVSKTVGRNEIENIFQNQLVEKGLVEKEKGWQSAMSILGGWDIPTEITNGKKYYYVAPGKYVNKDNVRYQFYYTDDNEFINTYSLYEIFKKDFPLFETLFGRSNNDKYIYKPILKNIEKEFKEYPYLNKKFQEEFEARTKGASNWRKVDTFVDMINDDTINKGTLDDHNLLSDIDFAKNFRKEWDPKDYLDDNRAKLYPFGGDDWTMSVDKYGNVLIIDKGTSVQSIDDVLKKENPGIYDVYKGLPEEGGTINENVYKDMLEKPYKGVINAYERDTVPAFFKLMDELGYGKDNINLVKSSDDNLSYYEVDLNKLDPSKLESTTYYRRADLTDSVDNQGRELTQGQVDYFAKSRVRDDDGNLIVVYHGTRTPGFEVFNGRGNSRFIDANYGNRDAIYFTSSEETAEGYTEFGVREGDNIYECYLNIEKPFVVDAGGKGWMGIEDDRISDIYSRYRKNFIDFLNAHSSDKVSKHIGEINKYLKDFNYELVEEGGYIDLVYLGDNTKWGNRESKLYVSDDGRIQDLFDEGLEDYITESKEGFQTNEVIRWVNKMIDEGDNFDGIIINNVADFGPKGSPFTVPGNDYVVFNSNQVKSINNLNPTESENINFRRPEYGNDIYANDELRRRLIPEATIDGLTKNEWARSERGDSVRLSAFISTALNEADYNAKIGRFMTPEELIKRYREGSIYNNLPEYMQKEFDDEIAKMDLSRFGYTEVENDPKEIVHLLVDYVSNRLDKSRIGNLVTKDGVPNKEAISKLSDEEKADLAGRLGVWTEYYYAKQDLDLINGRITNDEYGKGVATRLRNVTNSLTKNMYTNVADVAPTQPMKLDDYINEFSNNGDFPYELGVYVDDEDNVVGISLGNALVNWVNNSLAEEYKNNKKKLRFFHNHPGGGYFSDSDLKNNKNLKSIGLILPGGVTVEFKNGKQLKEAIQYWDDTRKYFAEYQLKTKDGMRREFPTFIEDGVYSAYSVAKRLGVLDKQKWGVFEDIINRVKGKNHFNDEDIREILDISEKLTEEHLDTVKSYLTPEGESDPAWRRPIFDGPTAPRKAQGVQTPIPEGVGNITEIDVIQQILEKYENAVAKNIKDGTLTVKKSQDLKQQAMYALNTAVEDLIMPKYGDLLSSENRQTLLGLGYNLKIATNEEQLKSLKEADKRIIAQFRSGWSNLARKANSVYSNIGEMDRELMSKGKVFVERNGTQLSVDVHDELINAIKTIPDGAGEFTKLREFTPEQIKGLSNRHAYTLLKIIDVVKMNIGRGNFYVNLMMQLNPQLRNVRNGLNFFQAFKAVKVGDNAFIPKILQRNETAGVLGKGTGLEDSADEAIKSWILEDIFNGYASKGITMTKEDLIEIVKNRLEKSDNKGYIDFYVNAFSPYTNLVGLPRDTYAYLNEVFSNETREVKKLLDEVVGEDGDVDRVWGNILNMNVTLDDGSTVKIGDLVSGNADAESWKQRLFGEMNKNRDGSLINYKEEFGEAPEEKLQDSLKGAHAWYNGINLVTKNEADMITGILGNARKLLQSDTNTNQFVEFDYAIGGQNDILSALIESTMFNIGKGKEDASAIEKWARSFARGLLHFTGLDAKPKLFKADNWEKVKQMYEVYYSMPLSTLKKMPQPDDAINLTAFEMAKYFKTAESMLGSKDGAKGVALHPHTPDGYNVNKAFGNIGGIVRNVMTPEGVYSLMNKIGNNQLLGMFRFAKEGDAAYHPMLKRWGSNTTKARFAVNPGAASYQEYSTANRADMTKEFNSIFGTHFDEDEAVIAIQALGGVKLISDGWVSRTFHDLLGTINNTAVLTRALMSYPLQLFTIYPQLFAYNVKADGIKRGLGVENLKEVREIRKEYGILEGTYVEIPVPERVEKMIGGAKKLLEDTWNKLVAHNDNEEVAKLGLELDDGVLGLYGKTTSYVKSLKNPQAWSQLMDSTRDNANNIIDAAMAQTFKGLAFVKALQKNDFITFMNPKMFKEFMDDPNIAQEIKDKLLLRVDIYANKIFQDMLGTGFTGLDRVYTSGGWTDFLGACLSVVNFKGAWGTNMVRQTFEKIGTMYKIAKLNGANIDTTVKQIMATPEFTTLMEALWADMVWMWRMGKFTDTGKWEDDSETDILDFISWAKDNIDFVSQQWQGIVSFGGTRLLSGAKQGFQAGMYGGGNWGDGILGGFVGFCEAFAKNFGRNWKPWELATKTLLVMEQNGFDDGWHYLANEFYKLSGGPIRYQIEEGENVYGPNTPITIERGRIPSTIIGESFGGSDTSFSYKMRTLEETEYLKQIFNFTGDDVNRMAAFKELTSSLFNNSQFFKTIKNIVYGVGTPFDAFFNDGFLTWSKINSSIYTMADIEDDLLASPTFKKFYDTGKIVPPDADATNKLLEKYMKPNYIGGYKAYEGMQNFIKYGHINGKEDKNGKNNGNYYDKGLEELYQRIEEDNPGAIESFLDLFGKVFVGDPESDEARKYTYSWVINKLGGYKDDPEFNKYLSALYKGILNYEYYNELGIEASKEKLLRKKFGLPKELYDVAVSDIKKIDSIYDAFNKKFFEENYEDMYDADRGLMQNMMYGRVADELEEDVAKKYFSKVKATDWNDTVIEGEEDWELDSNIANQIRGEIEFRKYIDEGRVEDALTYAAIMTKRLATSDKSGLVRAALLEKYAMQIQNSDWSPEMKASALAQLVDNNDDVATYNSEFAEKFPEIYEEAKAYINSVLYNISLDEIENLNNIALITDALSEKLKEKSNESNKKNTTPKNGGGSGGGSGGGGLHTAGLSVVGNLSKRMGALQPSDGRQHTSYTTAKYKMLPVAVKGVYSVNERGRTNVNLNNGFTSKGYSNSTNTLGPITPPKINKAVKSKSTRKMTQSEENSLDLL